MTIGDRVPLFLSAMAGITDPCYSLEAARSGHVAGVSIGGYDIDSITHQASLKISKKRKEFTIAPDILFDTISEGLIEILEFSSCFINLRAVNGLLLPRFCEQISKYTLNSTWKPVIEINAHCGQPEMVKCGAGVALVNNIRKLSEFIQIIRSAGLFSGIKFKFPLAKEKPFDATLFHSNLKELAENGLNIAHIDSYVVGEDGFNGIPVTIASKITELLVIGNNSVSTADDCKRILNAGASGFSLARKYLKDKQVFETIHGDFSRNSPEIYKKTG